MRATPQLDALAPSEKILPLFRELGDLKRVFSAQNDNSSATRLFFSAWNDLISGTPVGPVLRKTAARALVATRLGDLDIAVLCSLGLSKNVAAEIACQGFDDAAVFVDSAIKNELRASLLLPCPARDLYDQSLTECLNLLARQPRAGVTSPGRQRLMLYPHETHAEHCLLVAVYGALLAPTFEANAETVFLAGLSHHFHNAYIPDTGYSGEVLIGKYLDDLTEVARSKALAQFHEPLRMTITNALADISAPDTPVSRAFHAADVLDRVIEIEQHFKLQNLTMRNVLEDYGLVHAGPNKAFHDHVLKSVGLA